MTDYMRFKTDFEKVTGLKLKPRIEIEGSAVMKHLGQVQKLNNKYGDSFRCKSPLCIEGVNGKSYIVFTKTELRG